MVTQPPCTWQRYQEALDIIGGGEVRYPEYLWDIVLTAAMRDAAAFYEWAEANLTAAAAA